MEKEPEIISWILVCETAKCQNQNIAIELETTAETFICGPCSNPIINVRKKEN